MRKPNFNFLNDKPPNYNDFTAGLRKLIDIALDAKKSLRFRLKFDYPRIGQITKSKKIRQILETKMNEEGLDPYLNEVIRTKTYLHPEAKSLLSKRLKVTTDVEPGVRKKVI